MAVKRPQHLIRLYNRILTELYQDYSSPSFTNLQEIARDHKVLFVTCIACSQLQLVRDADNWKCYNSKCNSNKSNWKDPWKNTQ
jgi:hypothetical protein